jgi:peptidoglycan hydrolase CwlO-like protein
MESTMVNHNTNDDDNEVGGLVEKVPHFITAVIAIGGLIAAYFMTIGDFKLKDMELQQKVTYLEQKVNHIEETVDSIKTKLEARVPVVDADRQDLRKEIDSLREVLQQMRPYLKK